MTSVAGKTGVVTLSNGDISGLGSLATASMVSGGTGGTISDDSITDADIKVGAGIADTKLGTIATAGKVANSATTATSANTASAIIARDASGDFSAGTITATLNGNATNVTGTVAIANGGTGATTSATAFDALSPLTTIGDMLYAAASGTDSRLAGNITTTKQFLTSTGTGSVANVPAWGALSATDIPSLDASKITSGTLAVAQGGTGVSTASQNYVFAAPSASTGAPSFRALVAGDIPWASPGAIGASSASTGAFTTLTTTGSLGVGSATPGYKLDVVTSGTGMQTAERLQNTVVAANGSGAQTMYSANRATSGLTDVAAVGGLITDTTSTAYQGALVFSTANNAAPAERMRIDNNGNVGIGTTAPDASLTIGIPTNAAGLYPSTAGISLRAANSTTTKKTGLYLSNADDLSIYTLDNLGIHQKWNGNVGIGTTSPTYISFRSVTRSPILR